MLKFMQISDTHLGAKLSGLPNEIADGLRQATRDVIAQAFGEVQTRGLDIVLMPGDLFEAGGIDPAGQLRFIYQLAESVAPVPVVITPGNHDPYGDSSPYQTESAPANVFLFYQPGFTTLVTPVGHVTGRAYQEGEGYQSLDWAKLPAPPPEPRLLVLHASLLHASDGRNTKAVVPTTQEALENSGYAYTALGHYHNFHEYKRNNAMTFAAYAGCPQGLGWDEPGAKGYVIGRLDAGGAELEFIAAARNTISQPKISLPPEYLADASERTVELLKAATDSAGDRGLLSLVLLGRWPASSRDALEGLVEQVASQVLFMRPADLSAVEFVPDLVAPGESELLDAFFKLCQDSAAADDENQQAWELTRYLGHRLLCGQGLPGEVAK